MATNGALNIGDIKTTAISVMTGNNFVIVVFIILLVSLCMWIYGKSRLNASNCDTISTLYKNFGKVYSINFEKDDFKYNLRDYYVKTAYNACSSGQFKNDFVNICALENVIKQGARCLDFEIYSLDNEPVIATSSVSNYNVKETYNSVKFGDALTVIRNNAFSGSTCPNPLDPIILHLRIKSNNKAIHDKIAVLIEEILYGLTMGSLYSYENNGENFGEIPLSKLAGKVVIIVDKSNPLFESSKLDEYVNLTSNSFFMHTLRYTADVKYAPDKDMLTTFNKTKMSIVLPDISASNSNYSAKTAFDCGCQFVAMCFQNLDGEMQRYNAKFADIGCAFILRPELMRTTKITSTTEPVVNPAYSYETRKISTDYYSFNI